MSRLHPKSPDSDHALLLVGHGSAEQAATDEFLSLARQVVEIAQGQRVEPCFLEFARPTIAEGFHKLVGSTASHVVVVPVLLFEARHAKRDIPAVVKAAAASHSSVTFEFAHPLGCHELILDLTGERYDEALLGLETVPAARTALVVVGRGSRDREATAEMLRLTEMRRSRAAAEHVRTAFVAMAQPALDVVLDEVARLGVDRVVVQPHLLFGGVLVDRVRQAVDSYAQRYPAIQWITTVHLGDSPLAAQAVWSRACDAFRSQLPAT